MSRLACCGPRRRACANSSSNWSMSRQTNGSRVPHTRRRAPGAVAAAVKDAADLQPARVRRRRRRIGRVGQGLRQVHERLVARRRHARDPAPPAARRVLFQPRQHAGADQRALAAARVAVHDEEPLADQPVDDVVDHPLAAEEDRPLVLGERPQPRIGAGRQRDGEDVGRGRVEAHRPPAAALFCVSHVLTSSGQASACRRSSRPAAPARSGAAPRWRSARRPCRPGRTARSAGDRRAPTGGRRGRRRQVGVDRPARCRCRRSSSASQSPRRSTAPPAPAWPSRIGGHGVRRRRGRRRSPGLEGRARRRQSAVLLARACR